MHSQSESEPVRFALAIANLFAVTNSHILTVTVAKPVAVAVPHHVAFALAVPYSNRIAQPDADPKARHRCGFSAGSINDLAKQRFNQMITNRVLGTVLLGINEQVNCGDCVSAFGSAGSFSAGIHGRKNLTANLSLLAGIAYTHYSEGGYSVTGCADRRVRAAL